MNKKSIKETMELLLDRTEMSIITKRAELKVFKNPKWTNLEIEYLLNEKDEKKLIKRFEGRTLSSIRSKKSRELAKFKKC